MEQTSEMMPEIEFVTDAGAGAPALMPYSKPVLHRHGTIAELTAASNQPGGLDGKVVSGYAYPSGGATF